jgi:hypothetical protein
MSTILKALRRLEEDGPPKSADALPATDPRAADELRDRILLEESAAQASPETRRDPSKRIAMLGLVATAAILILVFGIYMMTTGEPTEPVEIAVSNVSPPPKPILTPPPAPARAATRALDANDTEALAGVVSLHPTMGRTIDSDKGSAPAPAPLLAAAPIAVSPQLPLVSIPTTIEAAPPPVEEKPASGFTSPTAVEEKPFAQLTPPAPVEEKSIAESPAPVEEKPVARSTTPAPKVADEMALAAVTPTPAMVEAQSERAVLPSEETRLEPLIQRTRSIPTPVEASAPDVSTAIPKEAPSDSPPPSELPQAERLERPSLPDLTIVRTAWHPRADRRSTEIRLEATDEVLTLREGDSVAGRFIQEISPSAVLFKVGDVESRRRVGQTGAGD